MKLYYVYILASRSRVLYVDPYATFMGGPKSGVR